MEPPIDESKLVIACHCPPEAKMEQRKCVNHRHNCGIPPEFHPPLYYARPNNDIICKLGPNVTYADPDACPDYTWEKIPDESKEYVWLENCPLYSIFFAHFKKIRQYDFIHLNKILTESLRILKVGGQVLFSLPTDDRFTYDSNRIHQISENIIPFFSIRVVPVSEAPLYLIQLNSTQISHIIIFTKHQEGGKRRTRRTRRTRRSKYRSKRK